MQRMHVKAAFTIIAISLAQSGSATGEELEPEKGYFFTGNGMYSWCQLNRSMAQGYTAGVWDQSARAWFYLDSLRNQTGVLDARGVIGKEVLVGYCEPPHVTVEQITDVFCAYLRETPAERDIPAALLFSKAMKKAWPCKKS